MQLVFFSTFNAPCTYRKIRCDDYYSTFWELNTALQCRIVSRMRSEVRTDKCSTAMDWMDPEIISSNQPAGDRHVTGHSSCMFLARSWSVLHPHNVVEILLPSCQMLSFFSSFFLLETGDQEMQMLLIVLPFQSDPGSSS